MKLILLILFLLISFFSFAQQDALRNKIKQAADKIETKIISWRRDIHEHPELGNSEIRTSGIVAKHLQSLGLEVKTGVAKTGVVGILKSGKPGPVVALRADMDALPIIERTPVPFASKVKTTFNNQEVGVMHACGHDSHTAILMGVAEIFASMKKDLKGTIKFIFQPAEEGVPVGESGGAEEMVKEGVMNDPKVDVIFGLHSDPKIEAGKITYRPAGTLAGVKDMHIIIKGRPGHGANPWNSVDPIVIAAQIVNNLQTIVSRNLNITQNPGVVTIGSIHGGNRPNIIPEQVEMSGTIRSFTDADEKMMVERIRQIVTKTAEAAGGSSEVTIPYTTSYPVTYNDPQLMNKMLPTLKKTLGDENVLLVTSETVAEDFSFFQQKAPGLYLFFGCLPKGKDPKTAASRHTADFFIDESSLKTGVNTLANLTLDYLFFK